MGFPILIASVLLSDVKQAWCPCSSVSVAGSLDMYFISPGPQLLHGVTATSLHDNTRQSNRHGVSFWAWVLSVCSMGTLIHALSGDVMGLYCKTYKKKIAELKDNKSMTSVTTQTTAYSKATPICFHTDNNTQWLIHWFQRRHPCVHYFSPHLCSKYLLHGCYPQDIVLGKEHAGRTRQMVTNIFNKLLGSHSLTCAMAVSWTCSPSLREETEVQILHS